ncbi:dTDP-4-dehydrorhamnose reductase [Dysgonomonas sp. PH5-45]|uniref:dTDP-4-dehydrorhamnose reductase n=1 Tax=unclassified Dysgonomonas TaxID=2630389 RepID=UPI002476B6B6|nr:MULTISPECIES: dTDP-4-dehydrorhamnose reductase [unclassified Dysgonomonas]MDH6355249.1 dTDP-4-dehydrorhamnose reductase [Dysgonomonas sp. PH5-45]MDH6388129.1 dTDP-4-dehydrorhamnose reductase [Dysgonomonas sp. PH5-37]
MQKNILVTGANGQLGSELRRIVSNDGTNFRFFFTDVAELDITNPEAVEAFVSGNSIDYIINCAAYTAVDKAEDDEELCRKINTDAVRNLGMAATKHGARVIHVSTDYVFDGTKTSPYVETDAVCPKSVYGITKQAGEAVLQEVCPESVIIRTAWLYSVYGNNFVKTMIRLGKERNELNVVSDQTGTPTNAADLAKAIVNILNMAEKGGFVPGIYHYSDEGVTTWYDFTVAIHKLAGITSCKVNPIPTSAYPTRAVRPQYSVLDKTKIKTVYSLGIPRWEDSLAVCIDELLN